MRSLSEADAWQQDSELESALPSVSQPRGCILFVDDDESIARLGQLMLVQIGYEAVARTRSLAALDIFQQTPHRFDLVLTDLDMPHLSGAALARHLWDIRPDLPIILCTGDDTMTREQAHTLGFATFLPKPFGLRDIALTIASVLTTRGTR